MGKGVGVLPIRPRNDSFMIGNPVKWNLSIQYFQHGMGRWMDGRPLNPRGGGETEDKKDARGVLLFA